MCDLDVMKMLDVKPIVTFSTYHRLPACENIKSKSANNLSLATQDLGTRQLRMRFALKINSETKVSKFMTVD